MVTEALLALMSCTIEGSLGMHMKGQPPCQFSYKLTITYGICRGIVTSCSNCNTTKNRLKMESHRNLSSMQIARYGKYSPGLFDSYDIPLYQVDCNNSDSRGSTTRYKPMIY